GLAIDGVLLVTGVSGLRAAASAPKSITFILAALDVLLASADITLNYVLVDKLSQSPEGVKILEDWSTFMLYYGVASISTQALRTPLQRSVKSIYKFRQSGNLTALEAEEALTFVGGMASKAGVSVPTSFDDLVGALPGLRPLASTRKADIFTELSDWSLFDLNKLRDDLEQTGSTLVQRLQDSPENLKVWYTARNAPQAVRTDGELFSTISSLQAKTLNGKPLDVQRLFDNGFG
ncbi:MAG TPA: hypothetical protein DCR93_11745, partial [Cytophagales bacterium]|nr:hypothetical protein [Cytophagales bacterium]